MLANTSDRGVVADTASTMRELIAEELTAVVGGDGPVGCIPTVNCIGDPKGPKDLGEDDGW